MGTALSQLCAGMIIALATPALAEGPDTAPAAGDAERGRKLAETFCQGCHVIGAGNRHGGIDSTPSFFLMHDKLDSYRQRLWTLKHRPPHTAYGRLDDVSHEDIEHVIAYIGDLQRP